MDRTTPPLIVCLAAACWGLCPAAMAQDAYPTPPDGTAVKRVLAVDHAGPNLLKPDAWRPWDRGYEQAGDAFVCDNGHDTDVQRGVSQTVVLNQSQPEPILAMAWSKAENIGGGRDSDYSLYLDLIYADGTPLWGQVDTFNTGSHDWEKAKVLVFPEKPVRSVGFHMLLRRHSGKAWFREPELCVLEAPANAARFDGVAISHVRPSREGFQVRDVAAGGGFVSIRTEALGIKLDCKTQVAAETAFMEVTVRDVTGRDRAITLVYALPVPRDGCVWLHDPRTGRAAEPGHEYLNTSSFRVGSNGRLSRYPFGAVAVPGGGIGLGIDMAFPAFYRIGYNADTEELFLAYDIGLTPEKPVATLRFCRFAFAPRWGFRAALQEYYGLFPEHFARRISDQGLWMPFAKISEVPDWRDFGFRFKEGTNEVGWDDEHEVLTFRYTEPMTWWMSMPAEMPRTVAAALAEAQRRATRKEDPGAQALLTSGFHDEQGDFVARLLDTPWCNGAVWSINSMPGIHGEVTDFKNKWSSEVRQRWYGPQRQGDLDGEYIDSSEGYVTDELDFRRDHFAAAQTPLTFSFVEHQPAIFRGLIAFEYVRAIAEDVHSRSKLMMANATPIRLCWLAPWLDVMGSEVNWNPNRTWRPMSDADLLYRRALCGPKPYCFLMNTPFDDFSHELVDKYMKRCLAYGVFPGFFSHNASEDQYFTQPSLYERDRPLFKKYLPLCKRVAEAGWEPITRARSSDPQVHLERFGERYLTVFNDGSEERKATIVLDEKRRGDSPELVRGQRLQWNEGMTTITLAGEDVAVIDLAEEVGQSGPRLVPDVLKGAFEPPREYADDFGDYASPLRFADGRVVRTAADWRQRRAEILEQWKAALGAWPPLIERPRITYVDEVTRDRLTRHKVRLEIAPAGQMVDGYLLIPEGDGPFPAVLVVYYDAETGAGLGKELRDFGLQLARRGFVALSIGTPEFCSLNAPYKPLYEQSPGQTPWQPLSALAYVAANCHTALANLPQVDPARIGIVGHSYGGKWAMFASCLYDKFACAVWSDPGIVFDETRPNVNYWEPWYLGYEPDTQRNRGVPTVDNPRTGPYATLVERGHDLHELHVLMAPRPFLVSGGAEDPPQRWSTLNHTVAVNRILGAANRVAMTTRQGHAPTPQSNEQIYAFFEHVLK